MGANLNSHIGTSPLPHPASPANALRSIPSITELLLSEAGKKLTSDFGRVDSIEALRAEVETLRSQILSSDLPIADCICDLITAAALNRLLSQKSRRTQRVINGTGIIIHTNLGRAPMAQAALDAAYLAGAHYSNLEFDLSSGKRGKRSDQIEQYLRRLTGCESALVVNNNAAALLLVLSAFAQGSDVIVSRGELVEIGGGFRIPDVISQGGARLVEVGTTNKTRLSDYENAISEQTRMLLKVHASNYRIVGFTSEVSIGKLAQLGRSRDIPTVYDLGSGALVDLSQFGLPYEPTPRDAIRDGADIVAFSGDKLLGGPQCGIIIGRAALIERLAKHPLYRALRVNKLTLAALSATLEIYTDQELLASELPVLKMLTAKLEVLEQRANQLCDLIKDIKRLDCQVVESEAFAGGGTLPERSIASRSVRMSVANLPANAIAARLRCCNPPIIGTVSDDHFELNMRSIDDDEIHMIVKCVEDVFN